TVRAVRRWLAALAAVLVTAPLAAGCTAHPHATPRSGALTPAPATTRSRAPDTAAVATTEWHVRPASRPANDRLYVHTLGPPRASDKLVPHGHDVPVGVVRGGLTYGQIGGAVVAERGGAGAETYPLPVLAPRSRGQRPAPWLQGREPARPGRRT